MDADFLITGEEMDAEEEFETGLGRDLIIRRMIGELPTCKDNGYDLDQPTLLLKSRYWTD